MSKPGNAGRHFRRDITLAVRVDEQTNRAVAAAALSRHEKPSEWLRGAIRMGLAFDNILPAPHVGNEA